MPIASKPQTTVTQTASTVSKRVSGRPPDMSEGYRIETVTDGVLRDAAERFVYRIYRAVEYCAASPRERVEEIQRWADRSVFHVVINDHEEVVGTVRTVVGPYDDLPIGSFVRTETGLADPMCEVGALAVDPAARSTGVIEHLYRAAWMHSARSDASALVGVIEPWLLDAFTNYYSMPFVPIGESRHYLGAHCVPAALPMTGATYEAVAAANPGFLWWNSEAAEPAEIIEWGFPILLTDSVQAKVPRQEAAPR